MPSSIIINGERVYRPGVYVRLVDAVSPPTSFSAGNIALIGDFPLLKKGELYTFSSAESFQDLFNPQNNAAFGSGSEQLKAIRYFGKIAFNQHLFESDAPVDSLTLINVRDTLAASYSNNGLTLSSKLYGDIGNALRVKLEAETLGYTATVKIGTEILETFPNIAVEENASIEFTNNGTDNLSAVTVEVTQSSGGTAESDRTGGELIVRASRSFTAAQLQALADDLLFTVNNGFGGGVVKVTSAAAIPAVAHSVLVTGLDVDGAAATETITIPSGSAIGTTVSGTEVFSFIEKFELSAPLSFASADCGLVINYPIKSAPLSEVTDVGNFLQQIKEVDSRFTVNSPPAPVSADELDKLAETSILGAEVELTTLLYRMWERAFSASQYLDAYMTTNIPPVVFEQNLSGGAASSTNPVDDDWTDALTSILFENINIVVPWSTSFGIQTLVKDHCTLAAKSAGLERCAWFATPSNLSVNTAYLQYSKPLNDKNCAVVCQGLVTKRFDAETPIQRTDYRWTALALAVMQAATPPATPLTHKRFKSIVYGVYNSQIENPINFANEAIRKGLVLLTPSAPGRYWVERSVTTFLSIPNHPFFTEVSANESINVSLRDLRAFLREVIGSKATASVRNDVQRLIESRLSAQRDNQIIANFRNVNVTLVGDVLNVSYELAAQEPLNFIVVTTTLQQF